MQLTLWTYCDHTAPDSMDFDDLNDDVVLTK